MVKLNGPMFSIDASGKLADAIVFSKWKGRNYARSLVTPSNPQSGPQTGMRRMLKFLSQDWTNLGDAQKSSWNTPADNAVISNFNAFVGTNLRNWRNFLAPSIAYPIDRTGTPQSIINEAATAGTRQITISFDLASVTLNWGVAIFRDVATPITPAGHLAVNIMRADTVTTFSWIDTPLAAGTYYYNFRVFDINGVWGPVEAEVNATVV
jgi:hypothetical protein